MIEKLPETRYFSKIDLSQGYYRVAIAEEDRYKTAFSKSGENHHAIRMTSSLENAPKT